MLFARASTHHVSLFTLLTLLTLLIARPVAADDGDPAAGHRIDVAAGLGFSSPRDDTLKGGGDGGFLGADYVFLPGSAVTPRVYGGLLLTFPERDRCASCDIEAQIAFAGVKLRAMAPIPWVGPYLEFGLGLSAGYMRTLEGDAVDKTMRGLSWHVPVAVGLALGQRHQYDIAFSYLFHPEQEQISGAVAIGVGFAIP